MDTINGWDGNKVNWYYGFLGGVFVACTFTNLPPNIKIIELPEAKPQKNVHRLNGFIYITNDEKIKEGDLFLNTLNNKLDKCDDLIYEKNVNLSSWCKKIILTDNKDLIANGVQAIDDDSAKWLLGDSGCEWVEVKKMYSDFTVDPFVGYKIIIPSEECCKDIEGFNLGMTCPKCNKPFRSVIEEPNYNMKQEILDEMERLKEKPTTTPQDLIGRKVRGFKFDGKDKLHWWREEMEKYIGIVGQITGVSMDNIDAVVRFPNDIIPYRYPISLIHEHLVNDDTTTHQDLIGRKVRGFKFDTVELYFDVDMQKYVGKIGVIDDIDESSVCVEFENDYWWYPISLIHEHLVEEEKVKPHSFCKETGENCTTSYCDENGCLERKRNLVDDDINVDTSEQEPKQECCKDVEGLKLGVTCPKCNKPFRSIIEEPTIELKESNQSTHQFKEWHAVFELQSQCRKLGFSELEMHSVLSNRFELKRNSMVQEDPKQQPTSPQIIDLSNVEGVEMMVSDDGEYWLWARVVANIMDAYIDNQANVWLYAKPIEVKKVTMKQLEEKFGRRVEIVKED